MKEEEKEAAELPMAPSCSGAAAPSEQQADAPQATSLQAPQDTAVPEVQPPLPVSAYSIVHDDWSDMLTMALTDPNLAPHYKTMIHCLVASNRDMKNMIVMMRTQTS